MEQWLFLLCKAEIERTLRSYVEKVYNMEEFMELQKILIVEDDADISGLLVKIMEGAGYQVRQAFSGTEALFCMERELPDRALLI